MRVYFAAPGKINELHKLFREHATRLFAKHGMTALGCWVPATSTENKLVCVLAAPSREARDAAWKAFSADAEWLTAQRASEVGGSVVERTVSMFLSAMDFSPEMKASLASPRVFELRTYTTTPGNLVRINARFRNHTTKLFAKHGMTNLFYWNLQPGHPDSENMLVYFLAHKDADAMAASFKAFRADPDWIAAKAASEKEAGGSLTVPDGVKSELMLATDYSATR